MRIPTRMSHLSFHLKCQGHLQIQIPCSFKARAKTAKMLCWFVLWTLISAADSKCTTDLEIQRFCSALQYKLWSSSKEKLRIHTENLEELCTAEVSSPARSGCEGKSNNGSCTLRNHFKCHGIWFLQKIPTSVSSVSSISWVSTFFLPKGHIKLGVVVQNRANFASNFPWT